MNSNGIEMETCDNRMAQNCLRMNSGIEFKCDLE